MSEEKRTLIVKISVINVFNQVIEYLAKEISDEGREIPRELQVLDMKFELIHSHLQSIGHRALEIKDPYIIARLVALGILVDSEGQAEEDFEKDEKSGKGNA